MSSELYNPYGDIPSVIVEDVDDVRTMYYRNEFFIEIVIMRR